MGKETLEITLHGLFEARLSTGANATPRSAKTLALFALLAASPGYKRSRNWIKSKLWSDRGPEQSAASLRQALSELRKCFDDPAKFITIDRRGVSLVAENVNILPNSGNAEFLEGLSIQDPKFKEWLAEQRNHSTTKHLDNSFINPLSGPVINTTGKPVVFKFILASNNSEMETLFCQLFMDAVKKSVREYRKVHFISDAIEDTATKADLTIKISVDVVSNVAWIRASLEHVKSRQSLWSGHAQEPIKGAPPIDSLLVGRLIVDTSHAMLEAIAGENSVDTIADYAASKARNALVHIFSFDHNKQMLADRELALAFDADGSADHLAWRVYLKMMMNVERNPELAANTEDEIDWLIGEALALEPSNSLVLAAAAQAHMKIKNNVLSGYEYARRSVAINPYNPMALDALVSANIFLNRFEEAHQYALKARFITGNSPFRHWWEMACCITATATGRVDEALVHARTSHELSPNFRPPMRYLIALYSKAGNDQRAFEILQKLVKLEPDFSVTQLLEDPHYPAAALQRSKLFEPDIFLGLKERAAIDCS